MTDDPQIAHQLREALRPLWRRFAADRTISVGKVGVLAYLEKHGPTVASRLAAAEKISPQAITTTVRELESLGLIARTPDKCDRRRIWIELTATGRDRLEAERCTGARWLQEAIAERLTVDEQRALAAVIPLLHKLVADDVD
ncbi:MarR family winged helix-turn-helix transcriptional regulator [[Mycobacterium] burgundiense]|uniref:MarR family transcriptional regulator n=1 Tax=[Mycobacterium] burgundiense TaxID=3064286 RepID=A0ABM9M6B5_9MYCO|nr:MarR family transcriptional regulator [Mycolicibacterium sp. MU0053]CAJ1510670.1 MarR family transcriptional regulator [Mycolicibacterium sp. MU0053]